MSRTEENKLFGTDGIRAKVGDFPFDDNSILKIGNSIGKLFIDSNILIGRDTRISGSFFEHLIASGIAENAKISSLGIIPTPGLSYIVNHSNFDYGIMITASHNPYFYNGIKIFKSNGEKISEKKEKEIEDIFFSRKQTSSCGLNLIDEENLKKGYEEFLTRVAGDIGNNEIKLVIDCANGATFEIAPMMFRKLGFETILINANPDGKNINLHCGSTDLEDLKKKTINENADLGIGFDGDGDRVIFIDNQGNILDGDYTLFVLSEFLSKYERDFNKVVVGTMMSNLGLEDALKKKGINFLRTMIGDKNVYKEMKSYDSILGGEQSGHIILRNFQKTGDGILTTIFFIKSLLNLGLKPSDIYKKLDLYPQKTVSVFVREKKLLEGWKELNDMIEKFNDKYGKYSRLLIRYSGTEPKIRIMIESKSIDVINNNMENFVNFIKSNIGG